MLLQHFPMVVAKVVDQDEEDREVVVQDREKPFPEHGMGHVEFVVRTFLEEVHVVLFDIAGKEKVGFFFLVAENLAHPFVIGFA